MTNQKILKYYMEVILIIKYFKNNLKPSQYFGFIDSQWKKNMGKGFLSLYVGTFNNNKAVLGPYITCCCSPKSCQFQRVTDSYRICFKGLRTGDGMAAIDSSLL